MGKETQIELPMVKLAIERGLGYDKWMVGLIITMTVAIMSVVLF